MATIHEVATRAGVSVATVSRWLSGQSVRSAEDVQRAVEELGYRPNLAARSLRTGHLGIVGVIVPDITNPFFASIVKGLERAIPSNSYRMLLASSNESADQEEAVLADLSGRVDGFILVPAVEQGGAPAALRGAGVPAVLLDREVSGAEANDVVLVDNAKGARLAAEHLLGLGHKRIGMIHGPHDTTPGRERRNGFRDALESAGVQIDPALDRTGDFREDSGHSLAAEIMSLPEPPTALFSANNQMTIGALKALRDMGVRIPDEVSLIGFDDLSLGSLLQPPLTCISRPVEDEGELAMSMLLERLRDPDGHPPRRVVMDIFLEVRASTAEITAMRRPGGANRRRARTADPSISASSLRRR